MNASSIGVNKIGVRRGSEEGQKMGQKRVRRWVRRKFFHNPE
jgi:hypothetical protein